MLRVEKPGRKAAAVPLARDPPAAATVAAVLGAMGFLARTGRRQRLLPSASTASAISGLPRSTAARLFPVGTTPPAAALRPQATARPVPRTTRVTPAPPVGARLRAPVAAATSGLRRPVKVGARLRAPAALNGTTVALLASVAAKRKATSLPPTAVAPPDVEVATGLGKEVP